MVGQQVHQHPAMPQPAERHGREEGPIKAMAALFPEEGKGRPVPLFAHIRDLIQQGLNPGGRPEGRDDPAFSRSEPFLELLAGGIHCWNVAADRPARQGADGGGRANLAGAGRQR